MVGPLHVVNKEKGIVKGFLRPNDDRDIFVTSWELEKVHFVALKPFYKALKSELDVEGWVDPDDGGDKFESLYWERINSNGVKDHHIWWRATQTPALSKFNRWAMKLDIQTLNNTTTEIPYNGKKVKVDKLSIIVRCWFWLQWDQTDRFKNSVVGSLKKKFMRKIFKAELEQQWQDLLKQSIKIHTFCKTYLDMETPGEQKRTYAPEGGYRDLHSKM